MVVLRRREGGIVMSLARQLSQGIQKKKVSIDEVRENPSNFYEVKDSDVEKVMRSMLTEGQLENAVAYEDETPGDGKKYTLISGATRYRALCRIVNEGLVNESCDGMLRIDIHPRPGSALIESRMLRDANLQREKTKADMYHEIISCEHEVEHLRSRNPDAFRGMKSRDAVGMMLGITGRQVDNRKQAYIKETENAGNESPEVQAQSQPSSISEERILKSFRKTEKQFEKIEKQLSDEMQAGLDESLGRNVHKLIECLREIMNEYE